MLNELKIITHQTRQKQVVFTKLEMVLESILAGRSRVAYLAEKL